MKNRKKLVASKVNKMVDKPPHMQMPVPVRKIDNEKRITSFGEVLLGYNEEEAQKEALRCLQCKKPLCREKGCPARVEIPAFIAKIKEKDYTGAAAICREANDFPSFTSRCCPHEFQCEGNCILAKKGKGIIVGQLERFVSNYGIEDQIKNASKPDPIGKSVAVVGSGPAGLAVAWDLVQQGFAVTVFESRAYAGGLLAFGIPDYRLPQEYIDKVVTLLEKTGVMFTYNVKIGKDKSLDELIDSFDAVFLGIGEGEGYTMGIPGEDNEGVYIAIDFLEKVNRAAVEGKPIPDDIKLGKTCAIVGGGNVAMDSLRCAKRIGAEHVMMLYRRSDKEMPACDEECRQTQEEGIEFKFLTNPKSIVGENGKVKAVECLQMILGECDSSGRCRPIPVEGSEFLLPVDSIILAIGQQPETDISQETPALEIKKWGHIIVDEETGETKIPCVFAAGDIAHGGDTVVRALVAGKKAAKAIAEKLL